MRGDAAEQKTRRVSTRGDLLTALEDDAIDTVVVNATPTSVPSFVLPPHKSVEGSGEDAQILFAPGEDGVVLTTDNSVANIRIETDRARAAILNDASVSSLGTVRLRNVTVVGRVRILARGRRGCRDSNQQAGRKAHRTVRHRDVRGSGRFPDQRRRYTTACHRVEH